MNQTLIYILTVVVIIVLLLPITVEYEYKTQQGQTVAGWSSIPVELSPKNISSIKAIEISIEGLSHIKADSVIVYFNPSQEQFAQEVAQTLKDALQLCSTKLGIPIGLLSVALFPKEDIKAELSTSLFRVKEPGIWPLFVSYSWQSLQESDLDFQNSLYSTMPHEAIEASIAPLFYHDWHEGWPSRWIGNGLASYAGYIVAKEYASKVATMSLNVHQQRVTQLLRQGKVTYNLIKDFVALSAELQGAGYGIALAFWLDIAQRYGEETIRKFWQQVNAQSRRWCLALGLVCFGGVDAKKAARILSELTGEDIWAKLQNMDLREVLQTLERAAGVSPRP